MSDDNNKFAFNPTRRGFLGGTAATVGRVVTRPLARVGTALASNAARARVIKMFPELAEAGNEHHIEAWLKYFEGLSKP